MKCPKCGNDYLHVIDSRNIEDTVRRRRECNACKYRFTTFEISDEQKKEYDRINKSYERLVSRIRKLRNKYGG